ncbi:glycosyltransferase family 4 protein [Herbaspirillum sp.]|uniref:glycosyltransferase family 4 protein n=1 Tax=Herbaspirillum sp. TaxID=1890675 RepID=UPI0031E2D502
MRILVVSQYFWPENFRINDLVKEWVQRGHEVTVLTGIPNYPAGTVFAEYRQQPEAFARYEGARVVRVPMLPRGSSTIRLSLNYLSFLVGGIIWGPWYLRGIEADVIFVFEPSPVTVGLPAVWLGKIKKTPVVFWVLDLWPETLAAVGVVRSPHVLNWVGRMVSFIYNRCTLVLGQSRSFLSSIANYCNDKRKIRYFPSWAENVFMDEDAALAPELTRLDDGFTVLFAGNIGEAQDMPAVLDAVQLIDDPTIRWVIVGDGRKSKWLQTEVDKRGLHGRVLLPGRFPVERMPSFYAHADALLVSLKRDPVFSMTIPGKVQSYLMAGIPLLGMLDGEGAAVIHDANAGLACDAGDSAGLAKAVLALAAMSPEERRQLGVNGRLYAQKEFGRDQLMGRLEALLDEAMTISKAEGVKKAQI